MDEFNHNADSSAFQSHSMIPPTPAVISSRIPQRTQKSVSTAVSPRCKRTAAGQEDALHVLGPEITNMAVGPPRMQSLFSSTGVRGRESQTVCSTPVRSAAMTAQKRHLATAVINSRVPRTQVNSTVTTTVTGSQRAVSTARAKSATSMRRPMQNNAAAYTPMSRPTSAQEMVPASGGRITSVSTAPTSAAWDLKARLETVEQHYENLALKVEDQKLLNMKCQELQIRADLLESERAKSELNQRKLESEIIDLQREIRETTFHLEHDQVKHCREVEDLERKYKIQLEDQARLVQQQEEALKHEYDQKCELIRLEHNNALQRKDQEYQDQHREIVAQNRQAYEQLEADYQVRIREATTEFQQQIVALQEQLNKAHKAIEDERERCQSDVAAIEVQLMMARSMTERTSDLLRQEQDSSARLRSAIAEQSESSSKVQTSMASLEQNVGTLTSQVQSRDSRITELEILLKQAEQARQEMKDKLVKEETVRRMLHNQVQELKGNIRVFCRVRPARETESDTAEIHYPDADSSGNELSLTTPSNESAVGMAMGTVTTKEHFFSFDKVFSETATNADIFDEIAQLVQSALDGYNVCIFCYGQTGSGKTFTMSSKDGIIPRAIEQIFSNSEELEEQGWTFQLTGQFLEIYNESINDLLATPETFDKQKLEIRTDKKQVYIPGLTTVTLTRRDEFASIIRQANRNRSVAATKVNERSSRSHSVFMLTIQGENSKTGEQRDGTLNLIDLAGSERQSQTQAAGERLRESMAINKSLSCLRDVITALASNKDRAHIPYRNSKLTFLLQNSLGGNSKTLMFVNVSPSRSHVPETLSSLRFATLVNDTHIGPAKRK
ncbi:P-loop containing nucleoside triphosphate hydrolase protein [Lipomyces oligophaga]|uniref:P-loop containing nucleoside triphosphate hydrolase protein n=1 Tax=Lipomyces oligophaga TaxID=45792 RepID=UPI0034CD468A